MKSIHGAIVERERDEKVKNTWIESNCNLLFSVKPRTSVQISIFSFSPVKYIILRVCSCLQPNDSNLFHSLPLHRYRYTSVIWFDFYFIFYFWIDFTFFTSHQWKLTSIRFKYLISFWDDKLEFFCCAD